MGTWINPDGLGKAYLQAENKEGVYVIYAFVDKYFQKRKVVYVGRSDELSRRLRNHEICSLLLEEGIKTTYKMKCCSYSRQLEMGLIKKLSPILNLQHNKKLSKDFYVKKALLEL